VETLGSDLHGAYLYGAAVFADFEGTSDFDAHVLLERPPTCAGYFLCLHGPAPVKTFPAPTWPAVTEALDQELGFVAENLHAHAYCALNLARILYSHQHRDPVISKRFAGTWAARTYPRWAPLMEAGLRSYAGTATPADTERLRLEVDAFFAFARSAIEKVLEPRPGAW
jgi:hypothetical protein